MYFYVHAKFVKEKQYAKKLSRMSMRLNDLGIFYDRAEVAPANTIENIVDSVLSDKRYEHLIAVGDDGTASEVINALKKSKTADHKPVFGIIPIRPSRVASSLGIPEDIDRACVTISRRKLETVDLGRANDTYFLTSLDIAGESLAAETGFDKLKNLFLKVRQKQAREVEIKMRNFKIITSAPKISIINVLDKKWRELLSSRGKFNYKKINPKDKLLNLLIASTSESDLSVSEISYFAASKLEIKSKGKVAILADNSKALKPPLEVGVEPKKLTVIVGREREF
jgi:hypothetical protein